METVSCEYETPAPIKRVAIERTDGFRAQAFRIGTVGVGLMLDNTKASKSDPSTRAYSVHFEDMEKLIHWCEKVIQLAREAR